jgi:hypothetical protein
VTGVQDNDETEALIDEDEEESAAGVLENDEKMDELLRCDEDEGKEWQQ